MKLARKFIASVVTGAMLISNVSAATSVIADQTESTETEVVITETTESNETSETSQTSMESVYTLGMIAEKLQDEGIKSPSGMDRWSKSTLKSILTNAKYKGDMRRLTLE